MVKHTQTIRRQIVLSVFDYFVELSLKGLIGQFYHVTIQSTSGKLSFLFAE